MKCIPIKITFLKIENTFYSERQKEITKTRESGGVEGTTYTHKADNEVASTCPGRQRIILPVDASFSSPGPGFQAG